MEKIFQILDTLEEVINKASRIPMTKKVVLEAETVLDFLDQLRAALPSDFYEAQRVLREQEKMLAEAQQEKEAIIAMVKKEAEQSALESEIVKQAQEKAREIIFRAQEAAQEIRAGADGYAEEVLKRLEFQLGKALGVIREGRKELQKLPLVSQTVPK